MFVFVGFLCALGVTMSFLFLLALGALSVHRFALLHRPRSLGTDDGGNSAQRCLVMGGVVSFNECIE